MMKQILSAGKSIKIVRYLENNSHQQLKRSKMMKGINKEAYNSKRNTLDHLGFNILDMYR